jgi:hypothetical protein
MTGELEGVHQSLYGKIRGRNTKLAETPLGGPRFMSFIRRWEMNNEPPPKEEKIEKYAFSETHSDLSDL